MSEHIKRLDGSYVLFLSNEEAELLGALRYKHIVGASPLYKILQGLPWSEGEFRTEQSGGKPTFHEFLPGKSTPPIFAPGELFAAIGKPTGGKSALFGDFAQLEARVMAALDRGEFPMVHTVTGRLNMPMPALDNLPRRKWAVECNFFSVGDVDNWCPSRNPGMDKLFDTEKEATEAFRNAPWFNFRNHTGRYRAVPVESKPRVEPAPLKPKRWVIQYNTLSYRSGTSHWVTLVTRNNSEVWPGEGVYSSRNEAYRQIALRAKKVGGAQLSDYRVVPHGTPDGEEKDRGFYRLQFWNEKTRSWLASADRKHYATAEACSASAGGKIGLTYRVKWYPSNAS